MKTLIAFFSGTGNTRYCAGYLAARLRESGDDVRVRSIETLAHAEIAAADRLVVGFPVYACDMPSLMKAYLGHLPDAAGKPAYVFCTKALYAGNAVKKAADSLKSRGYSVHGSAEAVMPGSDGLVFLNRDSAAAKKAYDRDFSKIAPLDRLAEILAAGPETGGRAPEKSRGSGLPARLAGAAADGFFKPLFGPLTHLMAGKFRADDACIRCGLCARICPAHNIRVTADGVTFGRQCYLCMRCVNQCPESAVQIGRGTVGKMRWKGPDGGFDPLNQDE